MVTDKPEIKRKGWHYIADWQTTADKQRTYINKRLKIVTKMCRTAEIGLSLRRSG
jgi:hypothetical protein